MLKTPPQNSVTRLYLIAIGLAIATAPALALDMPLARYCSGRGLPGDLEKGLNLAETYSHGIGVGLICLTVFVLDRSRRRLVWRLVACPLAAGVLGNTAKCLVARSRPSSFELSQPVFDSFGPWFPFWNVSGWDHPLQSFPSGHTATAVGLTVGLIRMYPQGKYLFIAFAILSALQRIGASAHYLSDTVAGAGVGLFFAALVCDPRVGGKVYDRLEQVQHDAAGSGDTSGI